MKANELRIGNWFIDPKTGKESQMTDIDFISAFIDQFKPIPLTEEWLLKFGFVNDEALNMLWKEAWSMGHPSQRFDMYWDKEHGFILSSRYQGFNTDLKMRHIKYVHQLQNLYFALTGEELIIKES